MLVFLNTARCLSSEPPSLPIVFHQPPSTPIWCSGGITFDPGWIKDVLLCAAVWPPPNPLLSHFNSKLIVLVWINHFCGSQEFREDVMMPHAPTKSPSQLPDLLNTTGRLSSMKASPRFHCISIVVTFSSVNKAIAHFRKFKSCISWSSPHCFNLTPTENRMWLQGI